MPSQLEFLVARSYSCGWESRMPVWMYDAYCHLKNHAVLYLPIGWEAYCTTGVQEEWNVIVLRGAIRSLPSSARARFERIHSYVYGTDFWAPGLGLRQDGSEKVLYVHSLELDDFRAAMAAMSLCFDHAYGVSVQLNKKPPKEFYPAAMQAFLCDRTIEDEVPF